MKPIFSEIVLNIVSKTCSERRCPSGLTRGSYVSPIRRHNEFAGDNARWNHLRFNGILQAEGGTYCYNPPHLSGDSRMKRLFLCIALFAVGVSARQSPSSPGQRSFNTRCAVCHGADGHGSDRAPSLSGFVASNTDEQIAALIRSGVRAMPPHPDIMDAEMKDLLAFLACDSPGCSRGGKARNRETSGRAHSRRRDSQ